MRTVGVEEEFLLVDALGRPTGVADAAVSGGSVECEFMQEMLETKTPPCEEARDLASHLRQGRRHAASAARRAGASIVALATSPQPALGSVTDTRRYRQIHADFGLTAREQLTCGCHVHVEVADADEGVAILDRMRPWLPCLLAMSANSPFWGGGDTGYASYRAQVWQRWPTAGPTDRFGDAATYAAVVEGLVASGAALDEAMVYFDARLSARYPTVEIRLADVCLRSQDALLIALIARALVETAARRADSGAPAFWTRPELLRAATWRASRFGLQGSLVDPLTLRTAEAAEVVSALLEHVRPVLDQQGEWKTVSTLWSHLRVRGTGAHEQRLWAERGVAAMVRKAIAATWEGYAGEEPSEVVAADPVLSGSR